MGEVFTSDDPKIQFSSMRLITALLTLCVLLGGCMQTLNVGGMLLRNALEPSDAKDSQKSGNEPRSKVTQPPSESVDDSVAEKR